MFREGRGAVAPLPTPANTDLLPSNTLLLFVSFGKDTTKKKKLTSKYETGWCLSDKDITLCPQDARE